MLPRDIINKALQNASGEADFQLEIPENQKFGDYSSNIALRRKNPVVFAEEIVARINRDKDIQQIVNRIEIAGGGFINFWLSGQYLLGELGKINKQKGNFGQSTLASKKTVIVEYSSPNIAKHFGVGHLRSTIIGQTLYNLYKTLGYRVIGENHLGDWGTQFGTLLYQIHRKKLDVNKLNIDKLQKLYVNFNKEAKTKPELWDEARNWFKKLEDKDPEARMVWEIVRSLSLAEYDQVYTLLGVHIDHAHGESFYEDKIDSFVKDVREKELSQKSKGAEIIELSGMPPGMLFKSDGASTYFTRDLAAIDYRIKKWKPSYIIYEVGSDQILHFKQVFEAVKVLGWARRIELVHVAHGLVRFKGAKMSTRAGSGIKLEDVLSESIKRAKKYNKNEKVAQAVGIGAIKYFDLMHKPESDIVFDWKKIFVLEGNSGPYLQYTYARANSVLAKAGKGNKSFSITDQGWDENGEGEIIRTLLHYPEILENAAKLYSPNLLCSYLFNLAQQFNSFYNSQKIIGSENEKIRLALTSAVGHVLKNGLNILGIETLERM